MTNKTKLPSVFRLVRDTIVDYIRYWVAHLKIILIVALPGAILSVLYTDPLANNPNAVDGALFLIALVMNLALLWAILRQRQTGRYPTLAQTYYDGSAGVVRFALVNIWLVIMIIPAIIGAFLLALGIAATGFYGFGVEQLIIALIALPFFLVTIFLLVRFTLALVAVVAQDARPILALRLGWRATRKRFWAVAGRLLVLLVLLILASAITLAAVVGLSLTPLVGWAIPIGQVLFSLLTLPLTSLYLVNLYYQLVPATPEPEAAP